MKAGTCQCGNRLFFNNTSCLKCHASVGRCNQCECLTSFATQPDGAFACTRCSAATFHCKNQTQRVCNSFVSKQETLCQWCEFTTITPDLTKPGNENRWVELERAKRQLLIELKSLGLPPFVGDVAKTHPLVFQFLEDETLPDGSVKKIYTGHDNGVIVVNTLEADSVYREQTRVALREPQRTLIGHVRHEIGHYIDWSFASQVALADYHRLFGDPLAFNYEAAMQAYYASGPPIDWMQSHVSAYATMHPWEDFAETVNVYLDVMAIAEISNSQGMTSIDVSPGAATSEIVASVLKVAVNISEFNLDFGLLPLLPEKFSPKVIEKLAYIHNLRSEAFHSGIRQNS
jgi:hypothetical protein